MSYNLTPQEVTLASIFCFGAMQKPEEFIPLYDLVTQAKPKVILEIGFGQGGTAWAWSKIPSLEHLVIIDLPSGPWGGSETSAIETKLKFIGDNTPAKVTYIAGNSANSECLAKVEETLTLKTYSKKGGIVRGIDFLWIDGDHSYAGVKTDFLTYSPLVNKPGYIALHDIAEHSPESGCEVKKFWDEIKSSGIPDDQYSEFIGANVTESGANWGGCGIIKW